MLKVALTGPHGVGKTYMTEKVAEALIEEGYTVKKMPSLTRKLKDMGYPINNEKGWEIWMTQLVCGAYRDMVETKAFNQEGVDVLLADRWVLDEYIYTEYFFQKEKDPRLTQVATLLEYLAQERARRWDLLYTKMPHPKHLPEKDGHRDPDLLFQVEVTEAFKKYTPPSLGGKHLPLDRDDASSVVLEDILGKLRR